MATGHIIWLALAGSVTAIWSARCYAMVRAHRTRRLLSSNSCAEPLDHPARLSVIVAAKDEEDNIETCITSLLNQDYPDFEVIAVDDRSTDRTPEILSRLQREGDGRLRVVTIETLRNGWFGKNNAMREGVEAATGEWFCFTDADCRQVSRRTLSVAMGHAVQEGVDFLSITPRVEPATAWEKIVQPVCGLVLIAWFLPEWVNDPAKKTAYANGAFMLMRKSCYDLIGGHTSVRAKVNEDIHMARMAKQAGQRLLVCENDDLYRVYMYRSARDAWRGWSRIFYGCLESLPRLGLSAMLLLVSSILPWFAVVASVVGGLSAAPGQAAPWWIAAGVWACALLLQLGVTVRFFAMVGIARPWALTYAFGSMAAVGILISAMLKVLGATGTTWRGTTYRGGQLVPDPSIETAAPRAVSPETPRTPGQRLPESAPDT